MIMESGLCQDVASVVDTILQTRQLSNLLNCSDIACMRQLSWQDIVAKQAGLQQHPLLTDWAPSVDNSVLTGVPAMQLTRPNGVVKSLQVSERFRCGVCLFVCFSFPTFRFSVR